MHIFLCLLIFWLGGVNPDLSKSTEAFEDHAIYLSTLKMEVKEQGIEITIKVFEDDLRDALRAHHGHIIDTTSASFQEEVDVYFTHHLNLGKEMDFAVSDVSLVGDSFVITAADLQQLDSSVSIEASYFMELFPTQQNVLHFIHGEQTKYHIFKKGKGALEISL